MGQYIHKKCDFRHKKGNKISLEISFLLNLKTCKKSDGPMALQDLFLLWFLSYTVANV